MGRGKDNFTSVALASSRDPGGFNVTPAPLDGDKVQISSLSIGVSCTTSSDTVQ